MIVYVQSLTSPPQLLQGADAAPVQGMKTEQRQKVDSVQPFTVLTAIPFDQPDPDVAHALRQLALYLSGIRRMSFGPGVDVRASSSQPAWSSPPGASPTPLAPPAPRARPQPAPNAAPAADLASPSAA